MRTDIDTCLKEIADWYVKNRREITEPELEAILVKHCEDEAEVQKFIKFLETEPGQLRFKTLLRERKGKPTGFTKGQTIVIRSKAIYGWRVWATVERDDPEHNQVWVKEITPAVKYEDIEEEDEEDIEEEDEKSDFWLGIAGAERKFPLGQIVMTRGVSDLVAEKTEFARFAAESLRRHARGDWGDLSEEDKRENERSLREGFRLLSAYDKYPLPKIWIITEADRSATTILFPEEY